MGVTKDFLTQLVQDNIYPNNSRLVNALTLQEVLVEMIGSFSLEQSFEVEEEVATGAKWIDGKDIYRRVINLDRYFQNRPYPIVIQGYVGSYCHVDHVQILRGDGSFCELASNLISVVTSFHPSWGHIMHIEQNNPGPAFVSGYVIVSYTKGEAPSY